MVAAIIMVRREATDLKTSRLFCGYPLFLWSIKQAVCSRLVDEVYLTTSDPEYQEMGRAAGAKIIDRPKALDKEPGSLPWQHAFWKVKEETGIHIFAGLLPTNPLRQPWDVDRAIELQERTKAMTVLSACRFPDVWICERIDMAVKTALLDFTGRYYWANVTIGIEDYAKPRPTSVHTYEGLPGFRYTKEEEWPTIRENALIYETPMWQQFDIETAEQFELCEVLMRHYILKDIVDVYERYAVTGE